MFDFVDSLGAHTYWRYHLVSSFPRRVFLRTAHASASLADLGLVPQVRGSLACVRACLPASPAELCTSGHVLRGNGGDGAPADDDDVMQSSGRALQVPLDRSLAQTPWRPLHRLEASSWHLLTRALWFAHTLLVPLACLS